MCFSGQTAEVGLDHVQAGLAGLLTEGVSARAAKLVPLPNKNDPSTSDNRYILGVHNDFSE